MSELGSFLGRRLREQDEDKQNLSEFDSDIGVPLFPVETIQIKDVNLIITRSDTGEWARRRWEWRTTEDFNTWTRSEGVITENNELKVK